MLDENWWAKSMKEYFKQMPFYFFQIHTIARIRLERGAWWLLASIDKSVQLVNMFSYRNESFSSAER